MPGIIDPTDPKIDRWLRRQEPRVELVLRYWMRGHIPAAKTSAGFTVRIDELFNLLRPSADEHAAILRHARAIRAHKIEQHVNGEDSGKNGARRASAEHRRRSREQLTARETKAMEPPARRRSYVTLAEIAEYLPILRVVCDRCGRRGRYRTDKLVAKYGADASIQPFQDDITRDCPKRNDPTIELGRGCAPLCPDLSKIA